MPKNEPSPLVYNPKRMLFEILIIEIEKEGIKRTKILKRNTYVGNLSFSPDGKKLALVIEERGGNTEIYTIDWNGENLRKLTTCPEWDTEPSWSPDGKKIAFQSQRNDDWKIYIMNTDGTNIERLTNTSSSIREKCSIWSPDGNWIAFEEENVKKEIVEKRQIILMDSQTKKRFEILLLPKPLAWVIDMCFFSDGKKIAFEVLDGKNRNNEIFTIDIDGKNLKNLTNTPDWDESCPSWRPIGK